MICKYFSYTETVREQKRTREVTKRRHFIKTRISLNDGKWQEKIDIRYGKEFFFKERKETSLLLLWLSREDINWIARTVVTLLKWETSSSSNGADLPNILDYAYKQGIKIHCSQQMQFSHLHLFNNPRLFYAHPTLCLLELFTFLRSLFKHKFM